MNESTQPSDLKRDRVFHTTSWSLVVQASGDDSIIASDALTQLCESYWYPLYVFVRFKGYSPSESEDLTQSFFETLLEKETIASARKERGKFRTFLMSCLTNFLNNYHRSEKAAKRGGGRKFISLNFESAEDRFNNEPEHSETPEKLFDRSWAVALLHQVMQSLRQQYLESGKTEMFDLLQPYIAGEGQETYADLGKKLNMKEGAVKLAVFRLRERYGQQLRLQIAKTTASPDQVDDELQHLFNALSN